MARQFPDASSKTRSNNPNFPCYGKVVYKTPKAAEGEARYTKIKGLWGGAEHPYFCKFCHAWHLTSKANKIRNKNYGRDKHSRRDNEAHRRRDY